ncbi:MAG: Hsp70 family protein, partial [Ferrovibrio sp.]
DRKARELVESRNRADSMIHSVRKSLTEMGDKLAASEKEKIEAAIKANSGIVAAAIDAGADAAETEDAD